MAIEGAEAWTACSVCPREGRGPSGDSAPAGSQTLLAARPCLLNGRAYTSMTFRSWIRAASRAAGSWCFRAASGCEPLGGITPTSAENVAGRGAACVLFFWKIGIVTASRADVSLSG